jgi:hypothetical protein
MENILVPETQEDQSDDPNLVLEGDDWLEWIMFSVGRSLLGGDVTVPRV